MKGFFEISKFKGGFGKIGRINLTQKGNQFIRTPELIIPVNPDLINDIEFLEAIKNHSLLKILNFEEFNKKLATNPYVQDENMGEVWNNLMQYYGFVYSNSGSLEVFKSEMENFLLSKKNNNIFPIIPFNVPTTALDREFAVVETQNYLLNCERILESYKDVNFGLSVKFFDNLSLLDLYIEFIKKHDNIVALNFLDLFDNLKNFRNIIKVLVEFKKRVDNNLAFIASGKILPKYYPMLIYLGFDLIDATHIYTLSNNGFYNIKEGVIPLQKLQYFPCPCKICQLSSIEMLRQNPGRILEFLYRHNVYLAISYMNKVKQHMATEDFRGFVEKSALNDLHLLSMLKILDRDYFEFIKSYNPLLQKVQEISCIGEISYDRPDFREFRNRVVDNFAPEKFTKLIVLFTCSAKKPYSNSKSHQKLLKVLRDTAKSNFPFIQELILTSPLGVIPRQLENIYPANSYDISVTGVWSEEEIKITSEMLIALLSKYPKNVPIIAHLEENYKIIVERAAKKLDLSIIYTNTTMGVTKESSLKSLEILVQQYSEKLASKEPTKDTSLLTSTDTRKIAAVIDYFFGEKISEEIIKSNLKIRKDNKLNLLTIYDKNSGELIGKFSLTSGELKLTIIAVERVQQLENLHNTITFDGDQLKGSTLFRPGIKDYGDSLQPSDIVIFIDGSKRKIIGMGTMLVGSEFIKNSKSGKIANIYESRKE